MEPKSNQTAGGLSALLVMSTDFSRMLERLDRMAQDLAEIKDSLPLRRRKLSSATKRAHISCILSWVPLLS